MFQAAQEESSSFSKTSSKINKKQGWIELLSDQANTLEKNILSSASWSTVNTSYEMYYPDWTQTLIVTVVQLESGDFTLNTWLQVCFHCVLAVIHTYVFLLSRRLVSMRHYDHLSLLHYLLTTPMIPQFATYSQKESPTMGASAVRKLESEREEAVKWTATLRFPPDAPETWITVNWHLEACGICLFMWCFPV